MPLFLHLPWPITFNIVFSRGLLDYSGIAIVHLKSMMFVVENHMLPLKRSFLKGYKTRGVRGLTTLRCRSFFFLGFSRFSMHIMLWQYNFLYRKNLQIIIILPMRGSFCGSFFCDSASCLKLMNFHQTWLGWVM